MRYQCGGFSRIRRSSSSASSYLLAPAAVGVVRRLLGKHLVVVPLDARSRRQASRGPGRAGTLLQQAPRCPDDARRPTVPRRRVARRASALTAACTTGATTAATRSRPARRPPADQHDRPAPVPCHDQTPLVVALHPTRPRLDLTVAEVECAADGAVSTWSALGAGAGALRTGTPAEVRADRDVVAVIPAGEVAPPLAVATVEGVDPLRNPSAYAVTTEGPAPAAVTTVTVTGDVMLGRRVGDRLAAGRRPGGRAAPDGAAGSPRPT